MSEHKVTLRVRKADKTAQLEARRVVFTPTRCFRFDGSAGEAALIARLADHLLAQPRLAFYGIGPLLDALLAARPRLAKHAVALVLDEKGDAATLHGLPVVAVRQLPAGIGTVFITAINALPCHQMRQRLPEGLRVVDVCLLSEIAADALPENVWAPLSRNIYPIRLPDIRIEPNLDLLVIDCLKREPHPTHAHLAMSLELAEAARAGRAVLTHMDRSMDYAQLSRELPPHVQVGYDGLVLEA